MKSHNFQSQQFNHTVVELKGEKKYFVEGFISTIDADDYNDIVTMEAQKSLATQVKNKIITMDVEHEEFIDERGNVLERPKNNTVPVAKIVDSELKANGVWVKAEINKHSSRFKEVWGSIKDRFLHSFSIAFTNIKAITKQIQGQTVRLIEDLNLINVTLTGSPVNTNATFSPALKAVLKNMEETKMTEEVKEQPTEEAKEEVKVEEQPKEEVKEEPKASEEAGAVDELKKQLSEQTEKINKLVENLEAEKQAKVDAEAKQAEAESKLEGPLSEIKSLQDTVESNAKVISDLKAKLEAPMLKSKVEEKQFIDLNKKLSPMDLI